MRFDNDLWRRLSSYLDAALDLEPEARSAWLDALAQTEPDIARELHGLLALQVRIGAAGFLEHSSLLVRDPQPGEAIGAYTIERLLGRGGTGSVWLAQRSDDKFEGRAAIKLLDRPGLDQYAAAQLRHEATFLARLSHAHIARLFDAGVRETGQPYLILEYIEGEAISTYCQTHALPPAARLKLFLEVLDAVAYAQSQLIVHGDLKPSNVLVTRDGEVKLVDFGVAALAQELPRAMTPGYAAPEQMRGEPLSAAADVYALGILLHLLLTDHHPFGSSSSTRTQLVRASLSGEAAAASAQIADQTAQRWARGDLDAIVAHALDRDPSRRYPTAADLAADIRRFIGNFPVHARRATRSYAAWKFTQRHWGAVLGGVSVVAVLIGATAVTTAEMIEARTQRDFARHQLARAESLNELNSYVLTDAAPGGKPFTVNELLGRAAHLIERQQTDPAERASLLTSIGRQYDTQDEDDAALRYLSEAYQLSRAADPSVRARAACALASALAKHESSSRPETLFAEGLQELPAGDEFALDRAFCWLSGNRIATSHGQAPLAVQRTRNAIQSLGQVPFEHALAELRAEADLAEGYREAGRYRDAIATFEQLWPKLVAQGRDDTATAGTWLNNWGLAEAQSGRPIEAEKLMRRSMEIHRADASDAALSPMLMTNYAQQLLDLGRAAQAQVLAERALQSATQAGDEVVINQTLLRLARIYRAEGQLDRSLEFLDRVEPRLKRMLPAGHYAFVALASERSQTLELMGDGVGAMSLADEAVRSCEAATSHGMTCAQFLPNLLRHRASLETSLRHLQAAETDARRALEMLLQGAPAGTASQSTGEAYLTFARCLAAQGRNAEAREMARHAADQLARSIGAQHPDTRAAQELAEAAG